MLVECTVRFVVICDTCAQKANRVNMRHMTHLGPPAGQQQNPPHWSDHRSVGAVTYKQFRHCCVCSFACLRVHICVLKQLALILQSSGTAATTEQKSQSQLSGGLMSQGDQRYIRVSTCPLPHRTPRQLTEADTAWQTQTSRPFILFDHQLMLDVLHA